MKIFAFGDFILVGSYITFIKRIIGTLQLVERPCLAPRCTSNQSLVDKVLGQSTTCYYEYPFYFVR